MPPSIKMEEASFEATLTHWRRKASKTFLIASALAYLPIVLIVLIGEGPPVARWVNYLVVVIYGILPVEVLLSQIDYRVRIWINLAGAYVLALIGGMVFPQGPFIRVFPLIPPLVAIVFFGRKAGAITTGLSIAILLFSPFFRYVPGLADILMIPEGQRLSLSSLVFFQGVALTAILLDIMVLLYRFHEMLTQSLADQTVAHRKLEAEMKQRQLLECEVAQAADEERRRLGHEIHDGICQQITAALLRSEALRERLDPSQEKARDELSTLSALLEETIDEARAVAHGLSPLEPNPDAFATSLHTLVNRIRGSSGVTCTLETKGDVSVHDSGAANHLYRIAQEAIINAVKHARASKISVTLQGNGKKLLLEVEDDGGGMPKESDVSGMGLRTMVYRAHLIGGSLAIMPGKHGGTRIFCQVSRGDRTPPNENIREINDDN